MLIVGTEEKAKYPFLAEAGQYLKDQGFTLEQFGADADLFQLLIKHSKELKQLPSINMAQKKLILKILI